MPKLGRPPAAKLIATRHISELRPGSLRALFQGGAAVVMIDVDEGAADIWRRMVLKTAEILPWLLSLADIAANHYGGADITTALGDVVYFQPGLHGYIGRKIELDLDEAGRLRCQPDHFRQNGSVVSPDADAMVRCWELVEGIMRALAPQDWRGPSHRAVVQRLKYQPSAEDFSNLAKLTHNGLSRWGRLGYRIDVNRGTLHHRLSGRWVSDAFGVLLAAPGLRGIAKGINSAIAGRIAAEAVGNRVVVERPHLDNRYFSALCGCRQSVRTEFLAQGSWHEVPVGLNRLAIMPGLLAKRDFQIRPLLHRVTYPKDLAGATPDPQTGDVTLLLGAV